MLNGKGAICSKGQLMAFRCEVHQQSECYVSDSKSRHLVAGWVPLHWTRLNSCDCHCTGEQGSYALPAGLILDAVLGDWEECLH